MDSDSFDSWQEGMSGKWQGRHFRYREGFYREVTFEPSPDGQVEKAMGGSREHYYCFYNQINYVLIS